MSPEEKDLRKKLKEKEEENRLLKKKLKETKEDSKRNAVLKRLYEGKQVNVTYSKDLAHKDLLEIKKKNKAVRFLLERKIRSPEFTIISLNTQGKDFLMLLLLDKDGGIYEISCYKAKGGPGYIKKNVS